MVCVAPRAATRPTRPAVTCRCSWRCAVASAEFALHQHAVDPAAKFEPDGTEHANLAKAEALMQTDRGVIRAVAMTATICRNPLVSHSGSSTDISCRPIP